MNLLLRRLFAKNQPLNNWIIEDDHHCLRSSVLDHHEDTNPSGFF